MDKKSLVLVISASLILMFFGAGLAHAAPTIGDGEVNVSEYDSLIQDSSNVNDYIEIGENSSKMSLLNETSVSIIERGNNSLEINVSSTNNESRVLSFAISRDVLNISSEGEVLVELDNESLELAGSLSDVLDSRENCYWPQIVGNNSSVILVSINNWSTHTLLFEKATSTGIIGGSLDDATSYLTQKIGPMQAWIYIVLAIVVLVVIASKLEGG